jgi:hypothetical protein
MRPKPRLKKGAALFAAITQAIIETAMPCAKDACVVTMAVHAALSKLYGRRNYYIKTVSNGVAFTLDGRRYVAVFQPAVAKKIVRFDEVFRRTGSVEHARAVLKPFKAELTIVRASTIAPPASAARKEAINVARRAAADAREAAGLPRSPPRRPQGDGLRQISM